ncbi:hypothetical protein Tco_0379371 [Tanacetum coccineum]
MTVSFSLKLKSYWGMYRQEERLNKSYASEEDFIFKIENKSTKDDSECSLQSMSSQGMKLLKFKAGYLAREQVPPNQSKRQQARKLTNTATVQSIFPSNN